MSSLETIVDHEVQRQLRDATRDAHTALHGVAADLSALGAGTTLSGEKPRLPDLTARASLLGALDGVEGSLLGASVLARGLFAALHAWLHPASAPTC